MSSLARRKRSVVSRAGKDAMPENQGLPAPIITAQLNLRDGTIEVTARNLREDARRISETIKRGRRNERCRVKLCLYLNLAYAVLWGGEPNWSIVGIKVRAEYEARFASKGAAAEARERVEAAA